MCCQPGLFVLFIEHREGLAHFFFFFKILSENGVGQRESRLHGECRAQCSAKAQNDDLS